MSKVESSRVISNSRMTVGLETTSDSRPSARVTRRRPLSSTLRPVESMNSTPLMSITTPVVPAAMASLRRWLNSGAVVTWISPEPEITRVLESSCSSRSSNRGEANVIGVYPYPQPGGSVNRRCPKSNVLADVHPRDGPGDHQLLDLGRALEDVVDLRVAVHPLDRELARVAVAAEDLHGPLGGPDGDLAGLELAHRALGVLELVAVAAHPRGAPDEQAGGVDLELHVGEHEGDRLVLDDLLAELLALLGVVERELVGGAGDAERLGADGRPAGLEGLHGGLRTALLALADAGEALVELLLAAEQGAARDAAVVEVHVGGVRGAQAVLLDLGALLDAARLVLGDDERGVAARAELAVDRRDDHVDVGDAAVGRPRLLAVDDPVAGALVELGGGADAGHVGAGVRLGRAERGDLRIVLRAVAARDPLADLLAGALPEDRGDRQRGAHERHADAGVAPGELLVDDRQRQAGRVGEELRQALEAVEADLRGLLDDRPGRLLALVPFGGGRTHDVLGEPMGPVADVLLVLVELEAEGRCLVARGVREDLFGGGGGFHV